jgi:hypothetical protein
LAGGVGGEIDSKDELTGGTGGVFSASDKRLLLLDDLRAPLLGRCAEPLPWRRAWLFGCMTLGGKDFEVSERGTLVGVLRRCAGLTGRASITLCFRAEVPNTCAAFDGIGGVGALFTGLVKGLRMLLNSFFFGLLVVSS